MTTISVSTEFRDTLREHCAKGETYEERLRKELEWFDA